MKIVRLEASNLLRLKAVEIVPSADGSTVVISGRNAQGKSSVLNAIWYALAGPKAMKDVDRPIRDGETEATVELDLGDILVTRTWKADGKSSVTVLSKDGAKYSRAQEFLDERLGALSFDPLAFTTQDAKKQVSTLLSLVTLPFDVDELNRKRQAIFDDRTEVGRLVKQFEGQLAGFPEPPEDLPTEEVSAATILEEQAAHQAEVDAYEALCGARDELVNERYVLEREIRELKESLAAKELRLLDCVNEFDAAEAKRVAATEPVEIDFSARLVSIDETNRQIRSAAERKRVAVALEAERALYDSGTEQIEAVDALKRDGLAAAEMPIDGLSFDDEGVIYQGVPLKQASSAEQLRVSTAMAMAMNPDIRVIRITDGSLLDAENLALLEEMAKAEDFQLWIERVGPAEVGFVIEDGEVVA